MGEEEDWRGRELRMKEWSGVGEWSGGARRMKEQQRVGVKRGKEEAEGRGRHEAAAEAAGVSLQRI